MDDCSRVISSAIGLYSKENVDLYPSEERPDDSIYMPSSMHYCSKGKDAEGSIFSSGISTSMGMLDTACDESDRFNLLSESQLIPTPPPEMYSQDAATPFDIELGMSRVQSGSSNSSEAYLKGSSLEDSPISSPSKSNCDGAEVSNIGSPYLTASTPPGAGGDSLSTSSSFMGRSPPPAEGSEDEDKESVQSPACSEHDADGEEDSSDEKTEENLPENIKLPQRKGSMQLWQFLYALLTDKKYSKLIEWTTKTRSREFRLLEPEAIAIWWGEHKNKKNMSYDKLSRSLRYYYDKGIIRKISGERYVYRFCINPELMYKHIGNSDCRPKLKPMPQSALRATSDYEREHQYPDINSMVPKEPCFIAQGPMSLSMMVHSNRGFTRTSYPPPRYNPVQFAQHANFTPGSAPLLHQQSFYDSLLVSNTPEETSLMHNTHPSLEHYHSLDTQPHHLSRIARSRSPVSTYVGKPVGEVPFSQSFPPLSSLFHNPSSPGQSHSQQYPDTSSPPPPLESIGSKSPGAVLPELLNDNDQLLNELIEFTTADTLSTTEPHQQIIYSTACSQIDGDPGSLYSAKGGCLNVNTMPHWNYN